MRYSKDKHIAALVRQLVHAGWRYHTGGRHGKLVSPVGRQVVVPSTPSDHRAFQNFKHDVRKLLTPQTP